MKHGLISVIIVNWNGRKWLKKCLSTLQMQSYTKIEIIMVDNASTDDSVEYVIKNFTRVKIIKNKKNLGLARANNIGVKHSKGEYLLLINTDVWLEKDFIARLLKFFNKNTYDVISPVEKRYTKDESFWFNSTIDPTGSPAYFLPTYNKNKLFFMSVCYFCTKKTYLDTKGFDENHFLYYEDVDWFWRLSLLGKKFSYVEDVFIYHAGAGSTGKGLNYKMFLWRNENALQTLLKNFSLGTLIIILPIYLIQNIFEILYFLITLKPKVAYSYIEGWIFNLRRLNKTLKQRRWIQKRRVVSDIDILKKMYIGSGKLLLLRTYFQENVLNKSIT